MSNPAYHTLTCVRRLSNANANTVHHTVYQQTTHKADYKYNNAVQCWSGGIQCYWHLCVKPLHLFGDSFYWLLWWNTVLDTRIRYSRNPTDFLVTVFMHFINFRLCNSLLLLNRFFLFFTFVKYCVKMKSTIKLF